MTDGYRLSDCKKAHFIGIGGISMSGLAHTLHNKGVTVTGSDAKHSDVLDELAERGIGIVVGHSAGNIPADADLVVFTAAVKRDNPEYVRAEQLGLRIIDRAALIGKMMDGYAKPVCVSGTHGKTTTTSMIAQILISADRNPTLNIGGVLPSINSNYLVGGDEYFVVESCEYFDGFLHFRPHIGVVLNIETDHLDYFRDLDHIEGSFGAFVKNISPEGALVINEEIASCAKISAGALCRVIGYGGRNSLFRAANVAYNHDGMASFDLLIGGEFALRIDLELRGAHNVSNALAAIAACHAEGLPLETIKRGLESFTGSKRRYEYKGSLRGITIVDDYAHHPTEIRATLAGAKNSKHGKLVCVFQPHTFTRTKKLLAELGESFGDADVVVVLDIYSAREHDTGEIHSRDLAEQVRANGRETHYMPSFDDARAFLQQKCVHGDLLITMGAGDVHKLGEIMLKDKIST
ncbi:MAG: UDP-N-acetylmuramate--L-alanine ligase [Defluviitaleaceae bacterium]|nr:UDP-N-acetylmuramate--L-alanine ligase [Defluviitaleaceae bacterium]